MENQLTLVLTDESGKAIYFPLRPLGATIGRDPDNDIVIREQKLSRRHAVIEFRGHIPFLSDEGSSNGTTLNGEPVRVPSPISEGDRIGLGGTVTLDVISGIEQETPVAVPENSPATPHGVLPSSGSAILSIPVLAGAAVGIILLIAMVAIIISLKGSTGTDRTTAERNRGTEITDNSSHVGNKIPPGPERTEEDRVGGLGPAPTIETVEGPNSASIERDIKRAMTRMSKDNAPYISPQGISDVAVRLRSYQGSGTLAAKIRTLEKNCAGLTALAQSNSLKPSLLAYAAMAEGSENEDPIQTARRMAPKLLTLRATFGSDTSNSSLLLIAAYPYPFNPAIGSQARTAHPLASKLVELGGRRSMEDTSVARSVWYLREKNGIMPEAYDLVVRTLAVGVIAQDPRRYGVDADPLFC